MPGGTQCLVGQNAAGTEPTVPLLTTCHSCMLVQSMQGLVLSTHYSNCHETATALSASTPAWLCAHLLPSTPAAQWGASRLLAACSACQQYKFPLSTAALLLYLVIVIVKKCLCAGQELAADAQGLSAPICNPRGACQPESKPLHALSQANLHCHTLLFCARLLLLQQILPESSAMV